MKKNLNEIINLKKLLLIVTLLIIFIHSFNIFQLKKGYFLDETATFFYTNCKAISISEAIDAIKNHTVNEYSAKFWDTFSGGHEYKTYDEAMDRYTVNSQNRFDYLNVYVLTAMDVHPPLYYDVLKTICSLFPKLDIMIAGFVVNIVFLLLTCLFIYKIGLIIFDKQYLLALIPTLYYGLSFDFVNNATFYRMYAMLTFWFVILLYYSLQWAHNDCKDDKKIYRNICIIEFLAMLTQYFALFFILPIFILNMILLKKNNRNIWTPLKYNIVTGVIYFVIWPFSVIHMLFSNRGADVRNNMSIFTFIQKLFDYRDSVKRSVFAYSSVYAICFIVVAVIFISYRLIMHFVVNKDCKEWVGTKHFIDLLYIVVSAAVYFLLAGTAAPWNADRYLMPVIPVFCIIVTYILISICSIFIKNRRIVFAVMSLFVLIVTLRWHFKMEPSYLYNDKDRIEFCKKYSDTDAIIISGRYEVVVSELHLNYKHLSYFSRTEDNYTDVFDYMKDGKSYILYLGKRSDSEKIIDALEDKNIKVQNLSYETDFYYTYKINKLK